MNKILMRANMSPLDNFSPTEVLTNNLIGNNMGNLLFPYSIFRTIMNEDTVIDTIKSNSPFTKDLIDEINEEYDCFVFPLANAFRISFISELKNITNLIKRLKIPCVIIGVGAQADLGKKINNEELDIAVTEFMNTVLEHSSIVGIRGDFTAEYLTRLGFTAEKHFTVIGCPSMYTYGKVLPKISPKELTANSSISINSKITLPAKFHNFIDKTCKEIPDFYYVPQVIEEIYRMYIGMPYPEIFCKSIPKHFPTGVYEDVYRNKRALSFSNVPAWLNFLSERDFSMGSRIHGNIAAILAGTPCYVFVSDERIKELAEYHNIPHSFVKTLNDKSSIFSIHEHADFSAIYKGHEARFMHYLDFLKKNNLQSVYDEEGNATKYPYDERAAAVDYREPYFGFASLSEKQKEERLAEVLDFYRTTHMEYRVLRRKTILRDDIIKQRFSRFPRKQIHFAMEILRKLR